jgi:REP element-mobilizing transposase RayT
MPIAHDTIAYQRNLPHLEKPGKTYFGTFCTWKGRELPPAARSIALASCIHDHGSKYWLDSAVVMLDHVHLILTPYEETLHSILQAIKSSSSHLIKRDRIMEPPVWLDESFDHILRSDESAREKAEYICNNPVRKDYVKTPDEWPWLWREWIEGRAGEGARHHTGL